MSKEMFFEYRQENHSAEAEAYQELYEVYKDGGNATIVVDLETLPGGDVPPSDGRKKSTYRKEALSPFKGRIFCVGLKVNSEPAVIITAPSEAEVVEKLNALLSNFEAVYWVGHNVEFDLSFLYAKACQYECYALAQSIKFNSYNKLQNAWCTSQRAMPFVWKHRVSLDNLCQFYGIESPKEGIDGSKVYDAYKEGQHSEIMAYCKRDVETTYTIYHKQMAIQAEKLPFK